MADKQLGKSLQPFAPYFLVVALSFLIYQLYLVQNSFSALYNIALSATSRWQSSGSLWPLVWLSSETSGEIGLLLRFVGACFFVYVAWFLLRKKEVALPFLRKAVLLEATYFLFYTPFVVYLLTRPGNSLAGVEAGFSYAMQIVLVSPSLFMLYFKLRRFGLGNDKSQVVRWFAIVFCFYVFALWVKHFMFAIYAVGINFTEPVLALGSVNSIATLLIAAVASIAVFLPIIREKRNSFNPKALGGILICIGAYFIIFILISLVNANYSNWVALTEWWATALPILGLGFVFGVVGKKTN